MKFGTINEFKGLRFTTEVSSSEKIVAVIGRNGSGKTRLLNAIAEGKIQIIQENEAIQPSDIVFLKELLPNIDFNFDPIGYENQQQQAVNYYNINKVKFSNNPRDSIKLLGDHPTPSRSGVSVAVVAWTAFFASKFLKKDINYLDNEDIRDFLDYGLFSEFGRLNVTAIIMAYLKKIEQNEFYEFRNHKYSEQLPWKNQEQFHSCYGPHPWEEFNKFLKDVLDGCYYINEPSLSRHEEYKANLYRREDDLEIHPDWLSSGEKVLMWLCLSMYMFSLGRTKGPPKLLLLDEPDSPLHPQMIQKLHMVLHQITCQFDCHIMFTTHSPTSIALFDKGSVWKISERNLVQVSQDQAIAELLVGLDQISIHYTNRRQVYVESNTDYEVYTELFQLLRRRRLGVSDYISLNFIPAAPKLSDANVRDIFKSNFKDIGDECINAFILDLNGQGSCQNVIGAVSTLFDENSVPVHGIIDWDTKNKPSPHLHVLGENIFYAIENAILNPLTLGVYLLSKFCSELNVSEYGLVEGFDPLSLTQDSACWQSIADGVMKHVLKNDVINRDVKCTFLEGWSVYFDSRYVHMQGHQLEALLRCKDVYPFLNRFSKKPSLLMDVLDVGIKGTWGRIMPKAFADLFAEIQDSK